MIRKRMPKIISTFLLAGMLLNLGSPFTGLAASNPEAQPVEVQNPPGADVFLDGPVVSEPVVPKISPAVRDLPAGIPTGEPREINSLRNFLGEGEGQSGTFTRLQDPLAYLNGTNQLNTPAPLLNFEGMGNFGQYTPPDTTGDVGPNHYIQMVNVYYAIYDKLGNLLAGPTPNNALWAGFGGPCENDNNGDPIVLYDDMADRWMLSQFAVSTGQHMCIAISRTPDPLGTYWLYGFSMPAFPDYPKLGVWPDAYYLGTNTGVPNQYWAHAFDRVNMLAGNAATLQSFGGYANFLMPADADGQIPPPPGLPGHFYTNYSAGYSNHPPGVDRLAIYEFDVDWATPDNSTFSLATEIPIAPYNYTVCGFFTGDCIPQPGTTQKLDDLSWWPMVRLQYRNLDDYQAMVSNFTVDLDGTNKAAIRWFELRKQGDSPWSLYQEGTHAPDSDHRWLGSIAMDGSGDIALGYSVSSNTTNPAIRYATRFPGDPLGTLQAEVSLIEGGGVNQGPTDRWGDYSSMTVDPLDQCTFWYTNEYHDVPESSYMWNSRIGAFKLPSCTGALGPSGVLAGELSDSITSEPIPNADVQAELVPPPTASYYATTDATGIYSITVSSGTYTVTASAYGYYPGRVMGVEVFTDTLTIQDFVLDPAPMVRVDGTVFDSYTGWPLYAKITIADVPLDPVWSDPITGYYEVLLPDGGTYDFHVEAFVEGYQPADINTGLLSGDATIDIPMEADLAACSAPGYTPITRILEDFAGAFPPAGWTVFDNEGNGVIWGTCTDSGEGNYTGGAGECAGVSSDVFGTAEFDTELLSPIFPDSSTLRYLVNYQNFANRDYLDLDVSTNGGSSWTNILSWNEDHGGMRSPPGEVVSLDLTPYLAGTDNNLLRWHYYDPNTADYDWYAQIDDVQVTNGCQPPDAGGLVVGNVYDDNTTDPLNGADVENEDNFNAISAPTPQDEAVDDGFYTIFSPSGTKTFTTTLPLPDGYGSDIQAVIVVEADTVGQDFYLPAGLLSAVPDSLEIEVALGYLATLQMSLFNDGALPLEFELFEMDGGFASALAAPPASSPLPASGMTAATVSQFSESNVTFDDQIVALLPLAEGVLLDQPPNQVNGLFADSGCDNCGSGQQSVADNFSLSEAKTIGQIILWTGYFSADIPIDPDAITVIFHEDSGGLPGAAVFSQAGVAYDRVQTGVVLFGVHEWMHTLTLSPQVALAPGTYWIEIYNETGLGTDDFFWETGDLDPANGLAGIVWATSTPGSAWNYDPTTELAFQLVEGFTDVPWLSEDPISGTLPVDSFIEIDVTFDTGVPEVTALGDYYATLTVDNDTPYGSISVPVTMTVVAPSYGVLIEPDGIDSGDPGTTVSYTLTLTNTSNGPVDSFDLSVSGESWTTTPDQTTVGPLARDESATVQVTVEIPPGAGGGAMDTATITATSQGDGTQTDTATLTTSANNLYSVGVTPATDAKSGDPGATVTYQLTVTNHGNTTDTFDVDITGFLWTTIGPLTVGPLASGGSSVINVAVDIPPGAAGEDDTATVTVTSLGDNTRSAEAVLITSALANKIYLPVIFK